MHHTADIRLLIAEDSPDDALLVVLDLHRAGFSVKWCRVESLEELRRKLLEGPWDLLVSDFDIPGSRGPEMVSEARRLVPGMPVIMVSGWFDAQRADEAREAGATTFLLKGSQQIAAAVRSLFSDE